ncbi:hypothetical protein XENTR_v10007744 [Xenopus tropicalis]|uniref:5'-(N(7)-methylguanosine 5'-triphospho)-[mRNA] hydrolase n=2 Tax=Xenopus tropicalis TaxID=8364 RepID=A0A8J0R1F5_XENTR|nr:mRNA-decapping enzyme 1B isoform X2 [Xenopus tropicalis]KAE8613484.1 hypothetical protein XENTR_v10007744 [Xenopus tropicalis]|eukprot:XP_004912545.1 PREDICTED: mRNA-decapping enzyme 1B isoform X2 [Xenopus tropicalis]
MAGSGSAALGRGLDISLAALRRHDPYIQAIVDVASQVALYTFSHKACEWEKTDVEGTLFVYSRSASPKHGFTIMNRLSMENRTEPITKDLDFQLQDPFLLYRNARFFIYGIWFYDKEECQRIAELMKNLTQQEQLKAQQGAASGVSPMPLGTGDGKGADILQMLTKAKDEYTKCKSCSEPKMITSSSAIYTNPNLIKPIAVKPSESQPGKAVESEKQHLSLTALFGKPDKAQEQMKLHSEPGAVRHSVVRSLSYEEPGKATENVEKQLCPAIQKLMVAGSGLQPVSEVPENRPCHNGSYPPDGDILPGLFIPVTHQAPFSNQDYESGKTLLQTLHTAPVGGPNADMVSSCAAHSLNYHDCSLPNQRTSAPMPPLPLSSQPVMASGTISPQELLKKLNLVRQEQQMQSNPRPALAAKFPVVSQSVPKTSWVENIPRAEKQNLLLQQASSPQHIPASVSPALLMSPMVFAQPSLQTRTNETANLSLCTKEPSNLLFPAAFPENPTNTMNSWNGVLTRSQLQETLLHLIQNDDSFLNTIYETYLSVLRRGGTGGRKI